MKQQNIDLGALQARVVEARKANTSAQKNLNKALEEADRSEKEYVEACKALNTASRAVLAGG